MAEETGERPRRRAGGRAEGTGESAPARDTIVINLPELDPELKEWLTQFRPGRFLTRLCKALPEDFSTHMRAARRERLLALRSLIDAAIARTEREPGGRTRAREVPVE